MVTALVGPWLLWMVCRLCSCPLCGCGPVQDAGGVGSSVLCLAEQASQPAVDTCRSPSPHVLCHKLLHWSHVLCHHELPLLPVVHSVIVGHSLGGTSLCVEGSPGFACAHAQFCQACVRDAPGVLVFVLRRCELLRCWHYPHWGCSVTPSHVDSSSSKYR